VIPGIGISLSLTILILTCFVLIPLSSIVLAMQGIGMSDFLHLVTSERALSSYRVTFGCAILAAAINSVFGLLVAWVLARYRFRGHRVLDACIDVPFALPTAVAGISLATLYGDNGWLGHFLAPHGIHVAYTWLGITLALIFVGMPFTVRTVAPVLADLPREFEEAALTLQASSFVTFFRVLLPLLMPSILTGFVLALARGIGEYGSVIFIAGNIPNKTEITSLLIVARLEEYDYRGAAALAVVLLTVSLTLILIVNLLQRKTRWKRA
jgi:sulfate transport system permease protein